MRLLETEHFERRTDRRHEAGLDADVERAAEHACRVRRDAVGRLADVEVDVTVASLTNATFGERNRAAGKPFLIRLPRLISVTGLSLVFDRQIAQHDEGGVGLVDDRCAADSTATTAGPKLRNPLFVMVRPNTPGCPGLVTANRPLPEARSARLRR